AHLARSHLTKPTELCDKLSAPAWRLWIDLARSDVMPDDRSREHMLSRHEIVVAIIEINSQQLRCDSIAAGLDIERLCAVRDLERDGSNPAAREALDEIGRRTHDNEEKKRKLNLEREWLEKSLADFDQTPPASIEPTKRQ
ncbi:MAG: hypothetical protein KDJ17_02115, partial [Hyphomicrobiaceae bacterium]|nr:hypothetical protein [Hyphomicrobiaceae bacterium]